MANEIIETYKLLQERIKSENARIFFEMLDSPYPAFKSRAIQELMKMKIETPIIKEYLTDLDAGVRISSFKYLQALNKLEEDDIIKMTKDLFTPLRKEALIAYVSIGIEPFEYCLDFAKDPDPTVRYQLLMSVLEFNPDESAKVIDLLRNDPYVKIQQLIKALEDIGETLKSDVVQDSVKKVAMIRYYEANDSMLFYNTVKEVYPDCNKTTKQIIVKFMAGLPGDVIRTFIETKIDEEKDMEILMDLINTSRKVLGKDSVPSWVVDQYVKSTDPKFVSFGLKLATERDEMAYVDLARELLDSVDDEYVIGAMTYLSYFLDYTLSDRIPDFLESLSSKRINMALRTVRKLKLDKYVIEISDIARDKRYPSLVRKNAINTLKFFKAKDHWEVPYTILRDPQERGDLKLASLNALLRLNPEMVENL